MRVGKFGFIAISTVLAGTSTAADRYTLDSAHSIPEFEFIHLGVTTQTGRFDKAGGFVFLDRGRHDGSVTYEVDAASLNMGFGTETPDSPGYHLLNVTKFPKITFKSDRLIFDQNSDVIAAKGQLTLLGISKPLTLTVKRFNCSINPMNRKQMCAGEVGTIIKRSSFGMIAYIPFISDEIKISVPVEAYKD
jgi:polyisoprenoid-binding protein YceI